MGAGHQEGRTMTRTVRVEFLDGKWPVEYVTIPACMDVLHVVEQMQRNYGKHGHQTGVKWQVTDGGLVDALAVRSMA
mgnify:CR=1 FL=1